MVNMGKTSEDEVDDPFQSSGDDWEESEKKKEKQSGRRLSRRLSKKPKISFSNVADAEEVEEDGDDSDVDKTVKISPKRKRPAPKSVANKKKGKKAKSPVVSSAESSDTEVFSDENENGEGDDDPEATKKYASQLGDYVSGSFVINRTDADNFSTKEPPNIWRIDGKALLQKYEPFKEGEELKFKNTSVYTGWSQSENLKYIPVRKVNIHQNGNQNIVVTFDSDQFKNPEPDSQTENVLEISD